MAAFGAELALLSRQAFIAELSEDLAGED